MGWLRKIESSVDKHPNPTSTHKALNPYYDAIYVLCKGLRCRAPYGKPTGISEPQNLHCSPLSVPQPLYFVTITKKDKRKLFKGQQLYRVAKKNEMNV